MANKLDFLDAEHPLYKSHAEEWARNEIRHHGGVEVLDALVPFDWEDIDPEGDNEAGHERYEQRKLQAMYMNFPDMLTTSMIGHLMSNSPALDASLQFGKLGKVAREAEQKDPSLAELVYYNVDGVGNDGSQWPNWWMSVGKRSMVTGHRWLCVDLPPGEAGLVTLTDVRRGRRPFLLEFSPLAVPNWHIENGQLQFVVLRLAERHPKVDERGQMQGNTPDLGYTLFVRQGFGGLGKEYGGGGWWKYDGGKTPRKLVDGADAAGDWSRFGGQIPIWPHFYERDPGTASRPAMSRSAITQLGQAAIAYMNVDSAAIFDAWEAAVSMLFFLGVNPATFKTAVKQAKEGSRWIGVETVTPERDPGTLKEPASIVPTIHDGSTGAVAAGIFKEHLDRIVENAAKLAAQEATSTPDSSGRSKEAGFSDLKAPRLALMASETEQSMNTAIMFLELAFGFDRPEGSVVWTREFNLLSVVDQIAEMFDVVAKTGIRSSRLDARALAITARERGVITDDDEAAEVERELLAAARMKQLEEMMNSVSWVPGPAKVEIVMQVFDSLGLFMDEEDKERVIEGLGPDGQPTAITLRDEVLRAAHALAQNEERRALQESSFFGFTEPAANGTDGGNVPGEGERGRPLTSVGSAG